jgi:peptide/nickel transport system permease protein
LLFQGFPWAACLPSARPHNFLPLLRPILYPLFFRKREYTSSGSLSSLAWKKFRKNRTGLFSLIFICIAVIIATLGYIITPDSTPFANDQCIELGIQKPGFTTSFLMVRKNQKEEPTGFIDRMIWGRKSLYTAVPIQHYHFSGTDIIVEESADSTESNPSRRSFNLADVRYALGMDTTHIQREGENLTFRLINGRKVTKPIDELQKDIILNNIDRRTYLLGTDRFGRDLLSQLIIGTRVSLSVGLISVAISLVVGIFLGAIGGYFRGWIDSIICGSSTSSGQSLPCCSSLPSPLHLAKVSGRCSWQSGSPCGLRWPGLYAAR